MFKLKDMLKKSRFLRFSLFFYLPILIILLRFVILGVPSYIPFEDIIFCFIVSAIGGFGVVYLADNDYKLFPSKNDTAKN